MSKYQFAYAAGALFIALVWSAFFLIGKTRRTAMIRFIGPFYRIVFVDKLDNAGKIKT